ncbi:hypothetical protein JTE90_005029 [Oedothorax gibbosus]|uniref:Chitin-binding type-2 domain-containing protein n=1 Tax=Oedothorax gibbosus TaxID=931172 RepID=A0AAV6VBI4_9ARAC|nr:hypothetical protein JTE90_005029 [Oedothorax gibbosus]
MRLLHTIVVIGVVLGLAVAEERNKRQAGYGGGAYEGQSYRPAQQDPRAYQQQPQQQVQHYPAQQVQHYPAQQPKRPAKQQNYAPEEEEKEQGPHPLQLLLEKSKFDCGGKSDGYYADSDVGCQAFHYCVTGQKHSMMCPEGTVFHQVHLNCVPNDQDICSNSNKFFFVNDYLNKELEQRGPNNTVQYHQRYYPDGYANGDPFIPPQDSKKDHQQQPPAATYGLGPAYREQAPPQAYQPQQPAHRPQPAPYRPAQQVQHYPAQPEPPRQAYHQPAPRPQQPQVVQYGYGAQQAQQAHNQQSLQAQRAYAQQQHQAAQPPQHQSYQQAQRQRYQ